MQQRRLKIVMADMKEINKHFHEGYRYYPKTHHVLLSNCHYYPNWIEKAIRTAQKNGKDTIMIGVDV